MAESPAGGPTGLAGTTFFGRTYDEALELVHETRNYLSRRSERDVRRLSDAQALAYSLETMRVTARLTQVMAWLMAQRAVHCGELTQEEVRQDPWRLAGHEICLQEPPLDVAGLPRPVLDLMRRSHHLFERIDRLDQMLARDAG